MKINRLMGFLYSFIPGAMHMYAGYMKQGLQLMGTFLMAISLAAYVASQLYVQVVAFPMFILAIMVWFFSFFDGLRLNRNGVRIEPGTKEEDTLIIKYIVDAIRGRYSFAIVGAAGIFMILAGVVSFANRYRWYGGDFYQYLNVAVQFIITIVICAVGLYLVKRSKALGEIFRSSETHSKESEDEELRRLEEMLKRELSENDSE